MQQSFSFSSLESQLTLAKDLGYTFITCIDYAKENSLEAHTIVMRVDIDVSVQKAEKLLEIFNRLCIKATFFVRLHAKEYNPFSFENYRILKHIRDSGHEIGYHSEVVDQASIWNEDPRECLCKDIAVINSMLDTNIKGIASHGGFTGLNNLDFWKLHQPSEFGLVYEAYDEGSAFGLFKNCFYISDSEWFRWKCYDHGVLQVNDRRSFGQHLANMHKIFYLLIHPETYYTNHCYE